MTKLQTWQNAQEILTSLGLTKEAHYHAMTLFESLLAPKKAGGKSRPQPITNENGTYYYCRFSDAWFKTEDMIYQNAEKREKLDDKGYSNIGISLWNKGQKYIKDGMKRATEINFGIISEYNGLEGDELTKYAIELYKEIEALKADNKPNDPSWLVENFITDAQREYIDLNALKVEA